ncbi:hypothetical protein H6G81_26285 [Scytonema hofmannii FACHB-248]|uniref:AsmA-like C-terminal domain-containing protein n=1 Tax=Scytonema hofmannii FACHB-248 TaxID=1842502 RepID=A0ABR8GXR9_9CYAN|nr:MULTISPECIES: hypothetical protein [Nostocales]MBD2607930.1 hypothetical protein [Scytonema hofmannii FACHB-248]
MVRRQRPRRKINFTKLKQLLNKFKSLPQNNQFQKIKDYLTQESTFILGLLILLICISLIATSLFWRGIHVFEGNLTTDQISFIYADKQDKLFINSIRRIKKFELQSQQTVTLKGKFSSKSDPKINQLQKITVKLTDAKSKFIIEPSEPKKASEIVLSEIRIQPNTEINHLSYNSYGDTLSFCLDKGNNPEKLCLQTDTHSIDAAKSSQSKATKLAKLNLEIGSQPLKVNLEGYSIAELGKPENSNPIEFIFTPQSSEYEFDLTPPTTLYINLPKVTPEVFSQWFRGKSAVENVRFTQSDRTGNVEDDLEISTILEGKVRMAEQELELKANQFLITGKPGIEFLAKIGVRSQPPQGLQVRFSGRSEGIEIGLDPNFIVDSIRPSFLAKYLTKDAISALISFCGGVAGALLPLLLAAKSDEDSNNANSS